MRRNMRPSVRAGFSILELLVVIGIICVLAGILLAVVHRLNRDADATKNAAMMTRLATAIQAYYTTTGSYPGPIPESMIWGYNTRATAGQQQNLPVQPPVPYCVAGQTSITSSENLVLALVGSLTKDTTPAGPTLGQIIYDKNLLQDGPRSLGNVPQHIPAYIDVRHGDLFLNSAGQPDSWTTTYAQPGGPRIFNIPEFMDSFSNPHPILYLRARAGAPGICDNPVMPGPPPGGSEYYSMEMAPYWAVYKSTTDRTPAPNANNAPFPSTPDATTGKPLWPDELSFFRNQTLKDNVTPRAKDAFILISAGADGIYGTPDDIVYGN